MKSQFCHKQNWQSWPANWSPECHSYFITQSKQQKDRIDGCWSLLVPESKIMWHSLTFFDGQGTVIKNKKIKEHTPSSLRYLSYWCLSLFWVQMRMKMSILQTCSTQITARTEIPFSMEQLERQTAYLCGLKGALLCGGDTSKKSGFHCPATKVEIMPSSGSGGYVTFDIPATDCRNHVD